MTAATSKDQSAIIRGISDDAIDENFPPDATEAAELEATEEFTTKLAHLSLLEDKEVRHLLIEFTLGPLTLRLQLLSLPCTGTSSQASFLACWETLGSPSYRRSVSASFSRAPFQYHPGKPHCENTNPHQCTAPCFLELVPPKCTRFLQDTHEENWSHQSCLDCQTDSIPQAHSPAAKAKLILPSTSLHVCAQESLCRE